MTKTDRALIAAYVARHEGERFSVTRAGEVRVYGRMPHSVVTGWWFAGYADDLLTQIRAEA